MKFNANPTIAIIGLGYVGLPLAVEFGKQLKTIGFDINQTRVGELREGSDSTLEVSSDELSQSKHLNFTSNLDDIAEAEVYIVTVPTPVDRHNSPNLSALHSASKMLGKLVSRGDIVIYESTVFPGATEEECVPKIEQESGLKFNEDFFAGYSPERINPGDKKRRLPTIMKITSGSTPEVAKYVDDLYLRIIEAGTHSASSIKVAEAAKVIENTQRDLNIALVNELALIFNRMDIDTTEVLEAAGTKWNFLPFRPGLVGGHCIGVDPYYLTYRAQEFGYIPDIILAGRRINDGMGGHIVSRIIKLMLSRRIHIQGANILLMGLTFKENCPDIRNTRVVDVVSEFREYGAVVDVYDPWVDPEEAFEEYGIRLIEKPDHDKYDTIVLAVAHDEFKELGAEAIRQFGNDNCVLYDVKCVLPKSHVDGRL